MYKNKYVWIVLGVLSILFVSFIFLNACEVYITESFLRETKKCSCKGIQFLIGETQYCIGVNEIIQF